MAVSGVFIWSGQSRARLLVVVCGLKAKVAPRGLGVVQVGRFCDSCARYVVVSDGECHDEVLGGLVVRWFWFNEVSPCAMCLGVCGSRHVPRGVW